MMENQKTAHIIQRDTPVITIKDLYKSFDDLAVLKGVNLTVYKGENVVVLGKSGKRQICIDKDYCGLTQT